MNGLQTERPAATSSVLGRDKRLSVLGSLLTRSGIHPPSYSAGTMVGMVGWGGSFTGSWICPCFLNWCRNCYLDVHMDNFFNRVMINFIARIFKSKAPVVVIFNKNELKLPKFMTVKIPFWRKGICFVKGFTVSFLSWPMWKCPAICNKPSMPIVRRLLTCTSFMAPRDTFGRVMKPLIAANHPQRGNKQTYLSVSLYCHVHSYKN